MTKTLRGKFTVIYSLYVTIFIFVIMGTVYVQEKKRLYDIAIENSIQFSRLNAKATGDIVEKNALLLENVGVRIHSENMDTNGILKELQYLMERGKGTYVMTSYIDKNGYMMDVFGNKAYVGDREYFTREKDSDKNFSITSPLIGRFSKVPVVGLGVSTRDRKGNLTGIVGVSVKLTTLSEYLKSIKMVGDSYSWVIDQHGTVVAHPNEAYPMKVNIKDAVSIGYPGFDIIAKELLQKNEGSGEYLDKNINEEKIITYSTIPNTPNWKLCITTLKSDVYSGVNSTLLKVLWAGVLMLFALIIIISRLTGSITKPINELISSVENSRNRNFQPLNLKIKGNNEITNLVNAYNEMTVAISVYTTQLESLVDARTFELDVLNKKLNNQNKILSEENESLFDKATRDPLTGLFNREELDRELEIIYAKIKNQELKESSIIFIDLDNFKYYNDTFGHDVGDEILKLIAEVFHDHLREHDFLARYGGDEFVLILPSVNSNNARYIKGKLEQSIIDLNGLTDIIKKWIKNDVEIPKNKKLGASMGIFTFDYESKLTKDELIKNADKEMYCEKKRKKNIR